MATHANVGLSRWDFAANRHGAVGGQSPSPGHNPTATGWSSLLVYAWRSSAVFVSTCGRCAVLGNADRLACWAGCLETRNGHQAGCKGRAAWRKQNGG